MKKILALTGILTAIVALFTLPLVTAYPWYSSHCVGCVGNYYTHHPYTQYYSAGYTYGYYGWDNYQVAYNYRYPYYQHYYSYNRAYPYSNYRGAYFFYGHPFGGGRFW